MTNDNVQRAATTTTSSAFFTRSRVAKLEVRDQELLVRKAHVAVAALDRLARVVGQRRRVGVLGDRVLDVVARDLVHLLQVVGAEVAGSRVAVGAAKRALKAKRRVASDVVAAEGRQAVADEVAELAVARIADNAEMNSIGVREEVGVAGEGAAAVEARRTAHALVHHADVAEEVAVLAKRASTLAALERSHFVVHGAHVALEVALLAESLATLVARVVVGLVRVVNASDVVAQRLVRAEASQTSRALRSTRSIEDRLLARRRRLDHSNEHAMTRPRRVNVLLLLVLVRLGACSVDALVH